MPASDEIELEQLRKENKILKEQQQALITIIAELTKQANAYLPRPKL